MNSSRVAFTKRDVTGVCADGQSVLVPLGRVLYDAWEVSRSVVEGVMLVDETGALARVRVVHSAVELYDDPLAAISASKEVADGVRPRD